MMVGMYTPGGVPEPAIAVQAVSSLPKTPAFELRPAPQMDLVEVSEDARNRASLAQLIRESTRDSDIQKAQIEQAKQNLLNGAYRILSVVEVVAGRVGASVPS